MRILTHFGLREPFKFRITVSSGDTVTLPLINGYYYNCWVYWGDGDRNHITTYNDSGATHTFDTAGDYTVSIHNTCRAFATNGSAPIRTKIKEVVQWGDCDFRFLNFWGCTNLTDVPAGPITGVSKIQSLAGLYYSCTSFLYEIQEDWFENCGSCVDARGLFEFSGLKGNSSGYIPLVLAPLLNVADYGFWSAFQAMPNMSGYRIPADLFVTNTKVRDSAFRDCFNGTNFVGTIPAGLFRANSAARGTDAFMQTFLNCKGLEEVEAGLLKRSYHPNCTGYKGTFAGADKLKMNRNIFFDDGGESTAFLNKTINFSSFMSRSTFTGTQGEAPALWNCNFGTGTPTKTGCFGGAGNSLLSLSNYGSITSDWK